jgi:hypothetical protein
MRVPSTPTMKLLYYREWFSDKHDVRSERTFGNHPHKYRHTFAIELLHIAQNIFRANWTNTLFEITTGQYSAYGLGVLEKTNSFVSG